MKYPAGSSLFLSLFFVSIFLCICTPPLSAQETATSDKNEIEDIVLYRNEALGFQLSLPDSLRETEGDQSSVTFESEDSSTQLIIALKDDLSIREAEQAGKNLENLGRSMLASAQRAHKDMKVISSGFCSPGGRKAYKNVWLTSKKSADGVITPIHYMQYVTINHGRLLLVQLMIIRSYSPLTMDRIEKALETLTFYGKLAF